MILLRHLYNRYQELVRFVIVGGIATAIHYGIYVLLNIILPIGVAYSIGYGISFICNFYLSSIFTFKSKRTFKKGIGFGLSHLLSYILHILLLYSFIKLGVPETWVPIPIYIIVVPIHFTLVRFVFKSGKI